MAFGNHLPINESLGVFVGVAGYDLLTEGQAEPLKAAALALAAGTVILVARRWLKKRDKQ